MLTGLDALRGELLSGVAFVQDYVELHFDGKILRALTNASITLNSQTFTFPYPGSRDALCSAIGRTVDLIEVHEGDRIEVVFTGGVVVHVPLARSARTGPEAAHFVPGEHQPLLIW